MTAFPYGATAAERALPDLSGPLGFGKRFTDNMAVLDWDTERGWHGGRITPLSPFELHPAALVFHYGQAIFEGLKAYRQASGAIALFRPAENARRFQLSARRMAMPELPEELFLGALEALVALESDWVPEGVGRSLYLRPFLIATEATLGVRPAASYRFAVIASPVDGFFSATPDPISVWLSSEYVRSARGGTGEAKFAGNYAGSMVAQRQAAEHGCDQVVWLDASERRYIEEMGAMNIFFVGADRLVTPPLTGTQLAGVTRDSLLTLAPTLGYQVEQRPMTVAEWSRSCAEGTITESFACGTAAVITPIGTVRSSTQEWTVGDGLPGPVTRRLRGQLLDIQYGQAPDTFGWMHKVA